MLARDKISQSVVSYMTCMPSNVAVPWKLLQSFGASLTNHRQKSILGRGESDYIMVVAGKHFCIFAYFGLVIEILTQLLKFILLLPFQRQPRHGILLVTMQLHSVHRAASAPVLLDWPQPFYT